MSIEAISWAPNLAPVPAGRNGQPSSPCKFVLVGLANHAGPDGTAAFPSARTLMRNTGLAERTVRACLSRLETDGIITPCDPGIIATRIRRADRHPKGWDLNLTMVRADLSPAEIAALERQFPGLAARIAASQASGTAAPENGVHAPHPAHLVDSPADEVQDAPGRGAADAATGCITGTRTVQRTNPRTARRRPPARDARQPGSPERATGRRRRVSSSPPPARRGRSQPHSRPGSPRP